MRDVRKSETRRARAKENQGTRTDITSGRNLQEVHTREELARVAEVSHDTISKVLPGVRGFSIFRLVVGFC